MTTEPVWVRPGGRPVDGVEFCASAAAAPRRSTAARIVALRGLMPKSLNVRWRPRHKPGSTRARFSSRAWQQFPTAIGTKAHRVRARTAKGALIAADARRLAVGGEGYGATLAFGPHFEGHTCSFRRGACSLRRY